MTNLKATFAAIPDLVIITDMYQYIIDYNHLGLFENMKKGRKISEYMKIDFNESSQEYKKTGDFINYT